MKHLTNEQISNDPKVIEWLTNIGAAKSTAEHYILWLRIFCECNDTTPSELIAESIKGIKAGLLPVERNEGLYLSRFKTCLKKAGYAETSFAHAIAGVKSFYSAFDIPLPKTAGKLKMAHPLQINQYFLTKDDIRKLITNAPSLREKAIILCMCTSGMAMMEIANLKVGMIQIDKNGVGTVTHRRQKTGTDYITFISPEASGALNDYWEQRNRKPETKLKGDNDFAFVSDATNSKGKPLKTVTQAWLFRQMGEKLGFGNEQRGESGQRGLNKARSHAFRKFFASTLGNAGMNRAMIDFMLGHFRSGSEIAYFNVDPEILKKLYVDFLPYLTFEKELKIVSIKEESEKRIAELENQLKEVFEMVRQMKMNNAEEAKA